MLQSKTHKTSLTAKVAQTVKSLFNEPKKFVNNDGTIAESFNSYKEFKQDLIKSSGFGW